MPFPEFLNCEIFKIPTKNDPKILNLVHYVDFANAKIKKCIKLLKL